MDWRATRNGKRESLARHKMALSFWGKSQNFLSFELRNPPKIYRRSAGADQRAFTNINYLHKGGVPPGYERRGRRLQGSSPYSGQQYLKGGVKLC
jgi:hypothetical protein